MATYVLSAVACAFHPRSEFGWRAESMQLFLYVDTRGSPQKLQQHFVNLLRTFFAERVTCSIDEMHTPKLAARPTHAFERSRRLIRRPVTIPADITSGRIDGAIRERFQLGRKS